MSTDTKKAISAESLDRDRLDDDDPLLTMWKLNRMVQDDRWELTELGREYLRDQRTAETD